MDEYPLPERIASQDLVACVEETMHVATLRYFDCVTIVHNRMRVATVNRCFSHRSNSINRCQSAS